MRYLVVAYPRLSAEDTAWVQAIRERHDPQFSIVAPHFTLIFPTEAWDAPGLTREIRRRAAGQTAFPFVIRCALPVKDLLSPSTHIFLVPDEGLSRLVRLHDALYAASLAPTRRLDIPFIPHITVGASEDPGAARAIADAINGQGREVRGVIDQLSVVTFDGRSVALREQIDLA